MAAEAEAMEVEEDSSEMRVIEVSVPEGMERKENDSEEQDNEYAGITEELVKDVSKEFAEATRKQFTDETAIEGDVDKGQITELIKQAVLAGDGKKLRLCITSVHDNKSTEDTLRAFRDEVTVRDNFAKMLIKIYLEKPLANFHAMIWLRKYLLLYRHDISDKTELKNEIAKLNKSVKARLRVTQSLRKLKSKVEFVINSIENSSDAHVLEKTEGELKNQPGPQFEYTEQ